MTGEPKYHQACLLLPEMIEEEYRDLVEDIREHGQRRPIIVDEDGVILDGRHRDRACRELGREPVTETFRGSESQKIALVISENVRRRHLTADQRAAIGAELATMKQGTRTDLGPVGTMSAAEAAKVVGSSERSIKRAKARMRADPEAHAQAKAGTLSRERRKLRRNLGDRRAMAFEQRHPELVAAPEPSLQDRPKPSALDGICDVLDAAYRKVAADPWEAINQLTPVRDRLRKNAPRSCVSAFVHEHIQLLIDCAERLSAGGLDPERLRIMADTDSNDAPSGQ